MEEVMEEVMEEYGARFDPAAAEFMVEDLRLRGHAIPDCIPTNIREWENVSAQLAAARHRIQWLKRDETCIEDLYMAYMGGLDRKLGVYKKSIDEIWQNVCGARDFVMDAALSLVGFPCHLSRAEAIKRTAKAMMTSRGVYVETSTLYADCMSGRCPDTAELALSSNLIVIGRLIILERLGYRAPDNTHIYFRTVTPVIGELYELMEDGRFAADVVSMLWRIVFPMRVVFLNEYPHRHQIMEASVRADLDIPIVESDNNYTRFVLRTPAGRRLRISHDWICRNALTTRIPFEPMPGADPVALMEMGWNKEEKRWVS